MRKYLSVSVKMLCRMLALVAVVAIATPIALAGSKETRIQKHKTSLEQRYAGKTSVVEKMLAGKEKLNRPKAMPGIDRPTAAQPYRTATGEMLYGFLMSDTEGTPAGIISISIDENATTSLLHESDLNISAGTLVLNELILETYSSYDLTASGLWAKDIATGEERQIATYGSDDPIFFDMTYDESRDAVYAVGGGLLDDFMSVYSINITDGSYEKLFEIDCMLYTLASVSDGLMYGIDDIGYLYRISVDEMGTEMVEWTGYFPSYSQSMTYNPDDGLFYWAYYSEEWTSSLLTVDPQYPEAQVVAETLGNNAEVGALYFNSDPSAMMVPSAPTDFDVMAGSNGALTATLMWVNPTTSLDGNQLQSITRLDVYRNGEVVKSFDNPKAGNAQVFSDTDVPQGLTTYRLVAVNEYGNGRAAESAAVYIGRDVPGTVRNLTATKAADSYRVDIAWDAPITGKHNGWMDASTLRYNVVRYPDGKVLAEGITERTYTDKGITETAGYSYGVVAINNDGEGDTSLSNVVIVGPALTIPFSCSFATEQERNLWIIEDANEDGCTWYYDNNWGGVDSYFMHYYYNEDGVTAANDWFFSAPIKFEAGKRYMLSYDVRLGSTYLGKEKFRVVLCGDMSSGDEVQEIDNCTDFDSNFQFENRAVSFTPNASGEYSLGFQVYSDPNQYFVHITNISITEIADVDMAATAFMGMEVAVRSEETTYEVTVLNNGANNMTNFVVNVLDADDGTVYGTQDVKYDLGVNKTLIVPVKCEISSAASSVKLVAEVIADGEDESVMANNRSRTIDVELLQDSEKYDMVKIGNNERDVSAYVPFDLHTTYSVTQMLFNPTLLGFGAATIERVGYNYYVSSGEYAQNVKVKMYMRNAENIGALYEWLDPESFTLVYEGVMSLDEDNNAGMMELSKPFAYTGKELIIMTETEGGGNEYYYNWFFASTQDVEDQNPYSMVWSGNEDTFDHTVAGMESRVYPQFTFVLSDAQSGVENVGSNAPSYKVSTLADGQISITGEYDKALLYSIDGMLLQVNGGDGLIEVGGYNDGIYLLKVFAGTTSTTHKVIVRH